MTDESKPVAATAGSTLFARPYLLLTLTAMFWGGNAVAGKFAVGEVSPVLLTAFRWLFASAIFAFLARPHLRRDWPELRRRAPILLGLGAVGFTLFNLFLYSSLQYTSAINAAIEQAAIPLFILLLNRCFFAQRVLLAQWMGLALATVGVVVTVSRGDIQSLIDVGVNRGDALMLLACLCYALYSVGLRWRPAVHWSGMMMMMSLGALSLCLPVVLFEGLRNGLEVPTATGWAVVLYAVVFPTVGAQLFYLRAVGLIGANRAGVFINLVPLFAAVFAVSLLGEAVQVYHVLGFVLVMAGIALSERSSRGA